MCKKICLKEIVVVEGRHDVDAVKRVVDATVLTTDGFGIFSDDDLAETLRRLGRERGVLILTDSDRAGFAIRHRLEDAVGKEYVRHVYIPDIYGKERRKKKPSREGKLGVEGMRDEALQLAFERAGVMDCGRKPIWLTKARLYGDGLSGRSQSREKCARLKKYFGLPQNLSVSRMMEVLNVLTDEEGYQVALQETERQKETEDLS